MIYSQLGRLHSTIQEFNKDKDKDFHSCLTTQVENLHAVGHFKDEFPTVLNFARNLGNSVYGSIKMITNWAAYYSPQLFVRILPQQGLISHTGTLAN